MTGAFDEARSCVQSARETYTELGQATGAEYSCGDSGSQIEILAGDLDRAQALLEASYATLERHGERAYLATRAASLADVLTRREMWSEARGRLQEAKERSTPDDVATEWLWRAVESRLLTHSGEHEQAEQRVRDALAMLAGTDALNHQAACRVDLANVLARAGRPAEAASAVREALALY